MTIEQIESICCFVTNIRYNIKERHKYEKEKCMVGHRGSCSNCSPDGMVIRRNDSGRSGRSGSKPDGS